MLINPAQKMPSIQCRISIEFRDPAHQLSANILGSYLWRYLYLPSVSCLIHGHLRLCFIRCPLLKGLKTICTGAEFSIKSCDNQLTK